MKHPLLTLPCIALAIAGAATSCDDDDSKIGPALTAGEVTINIDSLTFDLKAIPVEYENFDARSGNLLLGNMDVSEYGKLKCSFVTRLMCATSLNVPDSLSSPERVDSCKLYLVLDKTDITGDSLAPQRVSVYTLLKQLPSSLTNKFDPTGYYDSSSLLGSKTYTASSVQYPDSLFLKQSTIPIEIPLSKEYGQEIFRQYKENPDVFQWPQTFAQYFPGLYVESDFGKGCVANISSLFVAVYYYSLATESSVVDEETVTKEVHQAKSVIPFSISPEVLSSNMIDYTVSDNIRRMVAEGETVITTPGGFNTSFRFPAKEIIAEYDSKKFNLSMVSGLSLSIPAEAVENDYGMGVAPSLLMIKTSEMDEFFAKNKLPDNLSSFTANYNSETGSYTFSSLRAYIMDLISKNEIAEEDVDFTIVPVNITQETESSYGTTTTYVTKCTPYSIRPTMTRLHTDKALTVFTFSSQLIK